jgi:polyphosphate:AMP phosphotransferase
MFEQVDLSLSCSKEEYKAKLNHYQHSIYELQQILRETRRSVIILFEGWAGTSKVGTLSMITGRLDPRYLRVHPITPPRTYERMYPWLHRFWLKIPSYGQIALFDRSWYRQVLSERTVDKCSQDVWLKRFDDISSFERQLADDGTLILKFWLHISKKEQARRFKKLQEDRLTAWQVTDEDRWQNKHYERIGTAAEDMIARTNTPHAPWFILPATDPRYARIAVCETIINHVEPQIRAAAQAKATPVTIQSAPQIAANSQPVISPIPSSSILRKVDLSLKLDEKTYDRELAELQAKLYLLGLQVYQKRVPVVLVFEGWDAAGKGGAIKRITAKLDPRSYIVHSIAAPTGDDKEHHYLYRFWHRLPPQGTIGIFDRSWYGRVLVERVEGFARPDEWQRAYAEINEFERQLVDFHTIICKFWLHVSPDEQLRRFEERQKSPYKAWKLTDEDWRNREKWDLYEQAADDMLLRTSTPSAPWTIVESNDKPFSRIKVLRTVVRRLENELGEIKL